MAQIIQFPAQPIRIRPDLELLQAREQAAALVAQAAEILSTLGEDDRKVAWLLEDSLVLFRQRPALNGE